MRSLHITFFGDRFWVSRKCGTGGGVWVHLQGEKGRLCLGSAVERHWWATSFFFLHEWAKKTVFHPWGADISGFIQVVIGWEPWLLIAYQWVGVVSVTNLYRMAARFECQIPRIWIQEILMVFTIVVENPKGSRIIFFTSYIHWVLHKYMECALTCL